MRSGLRSLTFALLLTVLSVGNLSAQPPLDPPPNVELQEVFTVGNDLAVTFTWGSDGAAPTPSARFKLLDYQGLEAGSVTFIPIFGPQTIWIPGGAIPRVGDSTTEPLARHIELVTEPAKEIVLENELYIDPAGPAGILAPAWPLPGLTSGKQCYLHVVSLTCDDPEDKNGDEPRLVMQGMGTWAGPDNVKGVRVMPINWTSLVCDTCQDINKTTSIDLYDRDDWPIDPDDHLGSTSVSGCSTIPTKTVKFSGSTYTYWLKYRVACFESDC